MLGVSLIIIAAAIVYMVETYISTYYTIEYMHGTSLFLILLAKYGTPVLFLLLCAYIAYRNLLKKQKAAASAASERPTSKEELYTNKIQTAVKIPKAKSIPCISLNVDLAKLEIKQNIVPFSLFLKLNKKCKRKSPNQKGRGFIVI